MPGTQDPSRRRSRARDSLAALLSTARAAGSALAWRNTPVRSDAAVSPAPAAPASSSAASASLRPGLVAALAVLALVCAYLLPGTLGHDPWKQDETYTFGIIQHMLETGDLLVPMNAGQPFVEKPPLYDWVAAALAWAGGGYLPLHDAARLASALFTALALVCVARLARSAMRERATLACDGLDVRAFGTLALFAGTLLVVKHSHDLMTDVALMAGTALGFCGLVELVTALGRERRGANRKDADAAALMLGAGVGIAFMTKGLFLPLVFGATLSAVPVLYPACRARAFVRALALAAAVLAPFALIWPMALYCHSSELFKVWFWDNNVGRFFGFTVAQLGSQNDKPLFIWRSLVTAGFPAGPLALAALASGVWRRWREPRVALPVVFCATGLALLQMSATAREVYLLPFVAPLALVAAQGIERWPLRLHAAWDHVSRALAGTCAALTWLVWSEMTESSAHASLLLLGRWLPLDWTMPIRPMAVLIALALTLGWLWLLPRFAQAGKWRGALSWCAGTLLAWGLVFTLLLPWIDTAKSYRSVFEDLSAHVDTAWRDGDCMASVTLGESEAPMLYYFTGILHTPVADTRASRCRWLIVQSFHGDAATPPGNWTPIWSGARPGDGRELLRVFARTQARIANAVR